MTTTGMDTVSTTMLTGIGEVELLGGGGGLVEGDKGRMRFYADAKACWCGMHEERGGLPCGHMRAVRHAVRRAADAFGGDRETAA